MTSRDPISAVTPPPTQRVGGLVVVPPLLRELGVDPRAVLQAADIPAQCLDNVDARIPVDAVDRLLSRCVQASNCDHFGLLVGQRWEFGHFGRLGELMTCAPTVGDALRDFCLLQYVNSDVGTAFVIEDGDSASFGYALYRNRTHCSGQIYDAAMALVCNLMRSLCRLHWAAREVLLSRPVPADRTPYRQCFGPRVHFDQVYSAVRFSSRWLTQPTPQADSVRHAALRQQIELRANGDFVSHLQREMRVLLIEGRTSGDAAAHVVSLHRRTLNRRLRAHGTTFQRLLDEVRMDAARELLLHTNTSIDQVAEALCYADVSAFMHAFRRWTRTTPAQFRHRRGG
jgi:AraC-like DNA-binding protein